MSSQPASKLIVLTGPSGVGKGTLLQRLLQRHPELFVSRSATTRQPRTGEVEGQDYYFVSRDRFQQMVAAGELLEWAEFAGNCYGTPRQPVAQRLQQGQSVILEIEVQGARQIRQTFPQALSIFVLPPSLAELEKRLRDRNQDSEAAMQQRLQRAQDEIATASEFTIQITNDDMDIALQALEHAIFPDSVQHTARRSQMKEKLLNWLNTALVVNLFLVLASFFWFVIALAGRSAGIALGFDLWRGLWEPVFMPAIGILMAGALVSGAVSWVMKRVG